MCVIHVVVVVGRTEEKRGDTTSAASIRDESVKTSKVVVFNKRDMKRYLSLNGGSTPIQTEDV